MFNDTVKQNQSVIDAYVKMQQDFEQKPESCGDDIKKCIPSVMFGISDRGNAPDNADNESGDTGE